MEGVALRRGPFSHGQTGRWAGREDGGLTVTGCAAGWTERLVRMGARLGRAGIGASPYDRVLCWGDIVWKVCRLLQCYNDSMIGCYN